jgi:hypothetical protein
MRVQGSVQLCHAPGMLIQPPGVLHVEHRSAWTWMALASQTSGP